MIETESSRNDYIGDSNTSVYDYDFKISNKSELVVYVKDDDVNDPTIYTLVVDTDFTVTGAGDIDGGQITLVDANQAWLTAPGKLLTDYRIVIMREQDIIQNTDLTNQNKFYPEVHEAAFDDVLKKLQQVDEKAQRSVKNHVATPITQFDPILPNNLAGQSGVTIVTNEDGDGWDIGPNLEEIEEAAAAAAAAAASAAQAAAEAAASAASAEESADSAAQAADAAASAADAEQSAIDAEAAQQAAEDAQAAAEAAESAAEGYAASTVVITVNNAVPGSGTGKNGDLHIEPDNDFQLWEKIAGTWTALGPLEGPQGDAGATGATGDTGPAGANGAAGAAGTNGATWRSGSGAPADALGANGDFYLDTATNDVYLKAAGTYSIVTNIQGDDGAAGAAGDDGDDGAPGAAGADGATITMDVGEPDNGDGNNGDIYIDTDDAFTIYLKVAGSWEEQGELQGQDGLSFHNVNWTTEVAPIFETHFMHTTTGADFTQSAANSGTSAVLTDTSGFSDHPGVWELSTGAVSAAGRASIHGGGNQIRFGGTTTYVYETWVYIPTLAVNATEDYTFWAGIHNGTTTAPTRGIGFMYDVGVSTSWKGFVGSGALSTIDLGSQVVAAATWTKLKVEVIQNGSIAKFYIDDTLVATSTLDANYPDNTDFGMHCQTLLKTDGTGARTVNLDYIKLFQIINNPSLSSGTSQGWTAQQEVTITDNNGTPTNVTGMILDNTVHTSAIAFCEVIRSTTVFEHVFVHLQYINGAWRVADGYGNGEAHGLTFTITSGGQVQYTSDATGGGTLIHRMLRFKV